MTPSDKNWRPSSTVPGIAAAHAIITEECRRNRGDVGAFEEAVRRLRKAFDEGLTFWALGTGKRIHLVLTVELPKENEGLDG